MNAFLTGVLAGLKNLISIIEAKLEALGSELITIFEQSFPAAEQAAIADLLPLGKQIITDLQNQGNLTGKQIAAQALAQMETSLLAAGKDFVVTFAMQAISIVMAQQVGNTADATANVSNGGNLPGGEQQGG